MRGVTCIGEIPFLWMTYSCRVTIPTSLVSSPPPQHCQSSDTISHSGHCCCLSTVHPPPLSLSASLFTLHCHRPPYSRCRLTVLLCATHPSSWHQDIKQPEWIRNDFLLTLLSDFASTGPSERAHLLQRGALGTIMSMCLGQESPYPELVTSPKSRIRRRLSGGGAAEAPPASPRRPYRSTSQCRLPEVSGVVEGVPAAEVTATVIPAGGSRGVGNASGGRETAGEVPTATGYYVPPGAPHEVCFLCTEPTFCGSTHG